MTRLGVLPLPPVTVGETTETPFVLLIDQAAAGYYDMATMDALRVQMGARTVLVFPDAVEADPVLTLTEEQQSDLVRRARISVMAPDYEVAQ